MFISYAPPTSASLLWFYYSLLRPSLRDNWCAPCWGIWTTTSSTITWGPSWGRDWEGEKTSFRGSNPWDSWRTKWWLNTRRLSTAYPPTWLRNSPTVSASLRRIILWSAFWSIFATVVTIESIFGIVVTIPCLPLHCHISSMSTLLLPHPFHVYPSIATYLPCLPIYCHISSMSTPSFVWFSQA